MKTQADLKAREVNSLFHLLRQLGDTQIAALAAWRDVQAECERAGLTVVDDAYFQDWWNVSGRAVTTLKWLAQLSPSPTDDGPNYWQNWQESLIIAVADHAAWAVGLSITTNKA
jgi:hypothetical protein